MKKQPLIRKDTTHEFEQVHQTEQTELVNRGVNVPKSTSRLSERDQLIQGQLYKAAKAAKHLSYKTKLNYDDLYGEACFALVQAYERWDPSRANFSTCVNNTLYFYLYNYLRNKSWLVKIPRKLGDAYLKINKERKINPDATLEQISERHDVPLDILLQAEVAHMAPYSLDVILTNEDEDSGCSYLDRVNEQILQKF